MKHILTTFCLFISIISSFGQTPDSLASVYQKNIKISDLKDHLKVLTSDELNGRETGTIGNRLAADYIQREFTKMGIPPLPSGRYFQTFPLITQKQGGITLTVDSIELEPFTDFYPVYGMFKNKEIKGQLLFVNSEETSDTIEVSYEGKVPVLYRSAKNKSGNWTNKLKYFKSKGVKSVIIIYEDYEKSAESAKRRLEHEITKPAEDGIYEEMISLILSAEKAEELLGAKPAKTQKNMEKKKLSSMEIPNKAQIIIERETQIISSQNVLGYIEGGELKEELVIVTAHYDHLGEKDGKIYYGADDDGSGTVALLEIAQAFITAKKEGVKFKRSILFMPVSGEEKGLLGSKYYTKNPVFPLENTITNLNIDMIGRNDSRHEEGSDYIYLIGSDKLSTDLHEMSEETNSNCCKLDLDYTYNKEDDPNRYYYRSDHYNFARNNIPVIFYFSGVHEDYHKPTDTMDKIDFEILEKRTTLVFYTAWELLMSESRPKIK